MIIHTEFEQNTEEWREYITGRIGGSSCSVLLAGNGINPDRLCCPTCNSISLSYRKTTKDHRCGSCKVVVKPIRYGDSEKAKTLPAGLKTLARKIVGEKITGPLEGFSNHWTERGHDLEPIARQRYEETREFVSVTEVGYIEVSEWIGLSPDGLVGSEGGIEIKSLSAEKYLAFLDGAMLDDEHYAQCQWFLYHTKRKWIDYVMFHPDFAQDITVRRIHPDAAVFAALDHVLPKFITELERLSKVAGLQKLAA